MTESSNVTTAEVIDDTVICTTVAALGVIGDLSDVMERGYIEGHPALTRYRLDLLEGVISDLRDLLPAEELKWRRTEVANGWQPPDPDAEHHAEVDAYRRHTGCCEWCPVCEGHDEDPPDVQEEVRA